MTDKLPRKNSAEKNVRLDEQGSLVLGNLPPRLGHTPDASGLSLKAGAWGFLYYIRFLGPEKKRNVMSASGRKRSKPCPDFDPESVPLYAAFRNWLLQGR